MPIKSMEQGMAEFKAGKMHSGKGGPIVKNRKQAIAISMSSLGQDKQKRKMALKRTVDRIDHLKV